MHFRALLAGALLASAGCSRNVDSSWHSENGFRWRELDVPRRGSAGFNLLDSATTGIAFVNRVSDTALARNRILAQGSGVCLGDVDGDGLADVFLARTEGPNALYRNRGAFRFEDVTQRAGVAASDRHSTGCALADVNGDGPLDLVLTALGGPNAVFINDGSGKFTEQTIDTGVASTAGSTTVALADVDGDGWLDLYVTNYKAYTTLDRMAPQERSFDTVVHRLGPRRFEVREKYRSEYKLVERDAGAVTLVQRADPDFFYRNAGNGRFVREPIMRNKRFVDAQGKQLSEEPEDFGLAAMFVDLDNDGAPELYVANDFEDPDYLWKNDGHGNFRLMPWNALRSTSNSGMAIDVADVNRDGFPDLFEADMLSLDTRRLRTQVPSHTSLPKLPGQTETRPQMQRNTLQLNRGDGTFAEVARFAGVGASGWSWSAAFVDVDLDGWEDILVATGHPWDVMDGDTQRRLGDRFSRVDWRRWLFEYPRLAQPNVAFRNRGDLTFEDASRAWRFDLGDDVSHGMALGDLDGDGDLDVVINRLGKPAAVLRNTASAPRVAVRLKGVAPNTHGVGAKVRVLGGAVPMQEREIVAGGLYVSSSEPILTFATGKSDSVTIEVRWRDGRRSVVKGARPNREYEVDQTTASTAGDSAASAVKPLFADVSDQLGGHTHTEPYFDDFARQVLLPNSLSQLGPGLAWFDVDGDHREDLVAGASRSGSIAVFHNEGGQLRRSSTRFPATVLDHTTLLGWVDGNGDRKLLAGVSTYEMGVLRTAIGEPSVVAYSASSGAVMPVVPGDTGTVGPLALSDYDGDGDLDLFVGARVVAGAYPFSARSRIYRNDGGRFVFDAINNGLLRQLGMVSAAMFTDIDGNGWPDLVVAIEWGAVRIFLNDSGRLRDATELRGLSSATSRWNGLATGDLDGDGRMDIVATSWGRNTDQHVTPERPLMVYRVLTPRGPEGLFAQYDSRLRAPAPLAAFPRVALALPASAMRLRTFAAYADAPIQSVLGPRNEGAPHTQITTLDHTVFLNRGDHFEARALPPDAQLAPAFYAGISDFDGDGAEDVFLTQNFFATDAATPRYDAGRGLLLLGDGKGGLRPLPGQRSGLMIYGEQRGAAYADYDGDGRLDLAVSQNAGPTRLFHNVGGAPGVRVRLAGPPANPDGVGSQMRLRYGDRFGPVREVQAGSGYWSQNGAIQVLGRSGDATELWVRWPGGREQVVKLTRGQTEIVVTYTR